MSAALQHSPRINSASRRGAAAIAPSSLLQRKRTCSCAAGLSAEWEDRRAANTDRNSGPPNFRDPQFGHDFRRMRVRSGAPAPAPTERDGDPDEQDDEVDRDQASPGGPAPAPAPAAAAPACPTDIRVVEVIQPPLTDADVARGILTGYGGITKLEVSDPTGQNWDGTHVHENLTSQRNTCQPGVSACPNTTGRGHASGSTFTVGRGARSQYGLSFPAEPNRFYDFHDMNRRVSLLHQSGLFTCERVCTQQYDCGGRNFGPTFVLTRLMLPDRVTVPGNTTPVDVTRVNFFEEVQAPGPGDFPERVLPPGDEVV